MHIGVISSSLGGHGSGACQGTTAVSNVDMARLLARSNEGVDRERPADLPGQGLPRVGPDRKPRPRGRLRSGGARREAQRHRARGRQAGCGFEAPLESFYRFLVDPEPYGTIGVSPTAREHCSWEGSTRRSLEQRKAFLRPDSLLLIVMLSDENDCSIREEGKNYLVAETGPGLQVVAAAERVRAPTRTIRAAGPAPSSRTVAPSDPACTGPDGNAARLTAAEDPVNRRCWDQKRRFGFDFLYPVDRYTRALTEPMVVSRSGELVPNPIFSIWTRAMTTPGPEGRSTSCSPASSACRGRTSRARMRSASLDLRGGLNQLGQPVGGLKSAAELLRDPPSGTTLSSTWEVYPRRSGELHPARGSAHDRVGGAPLGHEPDHR